MGEEGEARLDSNSIIEPPIQKSLYMKDGEEIATSSTVVDLSKMGENWRF